MKCAAVLALLLALSPLCSAQALPSPSEPVAAVSYETSAPELARLIAISQRLDELNVMLSNALASSKVHSATLSTELESLRPELSAWKNEAAALRSEQSELRQKLEASLTDSFLLKEALTKAETSLANSERSWKEYEKEAERQLKATKGQRDRARIAALIVAILAIWGWVR